MRLLAVLAPLALALPAQLLASANEPAPSPSPAVEAPKPAKPKKICRQAEEQSGSRIGSGRICKTEAEWAELDAKGGSNNRRSSRSFESN